MNESYAALDRLLEKTARRAAKRLTNVIPTARIVDEVSVRAPRGVVVRPDV